MFMTIAPLTRFMDRAEFLGMCAGKAASFLESEDQAIAPLILVVYHLAGEEGVPWFLSALGTEGNDPRLIESVIELKALNRSAFRAAADWVFGKADLGLAGARLVLEAGEKGPACPAAVDCLAALIGEGCCDELVFGLFWRFVQAFPDVVRCCQPLDKVFNALALSHNQARMECAAEVAGWVAPEGQRDVLEAFHCREFPGGVAEVKVALDIMTAIFISRNGPLRRKLESNRVPKVRRRQLKLRQKWEPPWLLDVPCFCQGGLEPVYSYFQRMVDDGLVDGTNMGSFVRATCTALGQRSFPLWLPHVDELKDWETARLVLSLVPDPGDAGYLNMLPRLFARFNRDQESIMEAALRLSKAHGRLLGRDQMADLIEFMQPLVLTTEHLDDLFNLALEHPNSLVLFAVASVERLKHLIIADLGQGDEYLWQAIARFHRACRARIDPACTAFPAAEDGGLERVAEVYDTLINAQGDEEIALLGELKAALRNMYDESRGGNRRSQRDELAKHWGLPKTK
jgi:hypothetical protein